MSTSLVVTLLGLVVMLIFLMPIGYMLATAFKEDSQLSAQHAPLLPAKAVTYNYQGKDLPLYNVPLSDGTKQLALVKGFREDSDFVDPQHPEKGVLNWKGRYRTLDPVYEVAPTLNNFTHAWDEVEFPLLFRNTLLIAVISTIGTLISCILVAYGFARLRFPGRGPLFILVLGTLLLPSQITLVPQFILFSKLHWVNTFLPLTVPAFFGVGAGAFYIFLIRQYLQTIPYELDEAARMDGANTWQILYRILLPLIKAPLTIVAVFTFTDNYNDFLGPLIYLSDNSKYTLALGLASYIGQFSANWNWLMCASLVILLPLLLIYYFAQRLLIGGIASVGLKG